MQVKNTHAQKYREIQQRRGTVGCCQCLRSRSALGLWTGGRQVAEQPGPQSPVWVALLYPVTNAEHASLLHAHSESVLCVRQQSSLV